jgi:trimethylamine:corrinoid methyltransferase-like protein
MEDSTLNNLRSGEWTGTRVFSREGFENWNSTGRKSVVEKARRIADEILERQDASLDEARRRMLFKVIRDFDTNRGAREA